MDALFEHPRLAAIYDVMEGDRNDLDAYLAIVAEFDVKNVLDVGCGTGVLALMLADRGIRATGVDPARGSLDIARSKPGAGRVTWIDGDARALPPMQVDLAVMTGNVAQAIADPDDWTATLRALRSVVRPGGKLVFETRDPARRGWEEWTEHDSHHVREIPGVGSVEYWVDVIEVDLPLVTFRGTYTFDDGEVLTSDSTLRFRTRSEVEVDLLENGWHVTDVRDAADRPGGEFVFIAEPGELSSSD